MNVWLLTRIVRVTLKDLKNFYTESLVKVIRTGKQNTRDSSRAGPLGLRIPGLLIEPP